MGSRRRRPKNKVQDLTIKSYQEKSNTLPHNDPEWYIYDREMFDGVISMPTLEFKGLPNKWKSNIDWWGNPGHEDRFRNLPDVPLITPTVAGYLMNPGLELNKESSTEEKYSAVNVAARKMYAELSASNAKTSMYAPQDISTLILALGQIISMATHLKRLYGIATYFNFYSRKVPEDLFSAMGVYGYANFKNNLSNFRNNLNRLISKIDSIQFPAGLSYFKKCEYVYQNIFVDRDEKMVSYHVMAPRTTWMLNEAAYSEGSILETKTVIGLQPGAILDIVEQMVERVLTSSTFNFIFSDILNLANRNVLSVESINVQPVPIDYVCEPVYSEQFNWQIMNMTIVPTPTNPQYDVDEGSTPYNDVYPDVDTNRIIYAPRTSDIENTAFSNFVRWGKTIPIRLPDTNPTQDMFVELLAYTAMPKVIIYNFGGASIRYYNLPDFYCTEARVVKPTANNGTKVIAIDSNTLRTVDSEKISAISQFVHFPFIAIMDNNTTSTDPCDITPISRMSAYTQIDENAISNLRYETYLGLFTFRK